MLLTLLTVCLPLTAAHADETKPPQEPKIGKKISITMVIPGFNQLKNKKFFKGSLLLLAFAGATAGAVISNKKGNDWYDKYLDSNNIADVIHYREKTEQHFKGRNYFMIGALGVWVLHLLDLQFSGKGKKKGLTGAVGKNSMSLGFFYRF